MHCEAAILSSGLLSKEGDIDRYSDEAWQTLKISVLRLRFYRCAVERNEYQSLVVLRWPSASYRLRSRTEYRLLDQHYIGADLKAITECLVARYADSFFSCLASTGDLQINEWSSRISTGTLPPMQCHQPCINLSFLKTRSYRSEATFASYTQLKLI